MIRSPISKVLSTMNRNGVKALLTGGQACIFYGGAEFSRDIDFSLQVSEDSLTRLIEAHYAQNPENPNLEQIEFWLTESFEILFLQQRVSEFSETASRIRHKGPAVYSH